MDNRSLKLVNVWLWTGRFITPETLANDAKSWGNVKLFPGIGKENFDLSDDALLRMICFELMPFSLVGEENTVVRAEIARFPYSINGEHEYQAFAIRLTPEKGQLTKINFHEGHGLAVSSSIIGREGFSADIGNGVLHLEVFFETIENLPALTPPTGFKSEHNIDFDNASD